MKVLVTIILTFLIVITASYLIGCYSQSQDVEPVYNVTLEEHELIAKIVWLEAGICSEDCQKAIASVIFNQLNAGYWGDTISEVIYHEGGFVSVDYLDQAQPSEITYKAVDYVINNGPTLPSEVRYFRNNHDFTWDHYVHYITIDNVYFGYFDNTNIH